MAFKLKPTTASMNNLNPRPQASGDERELAVDIDLEFLGDKTLLDGLLFKAVPFIKALWTTRGNVADMAIGKVALRNEFDGAQVKVSTVGEEGVTLNQCHLKKFSFMALDADQVKLHFQVQCLPTDEAYLFLGHALRRPEVTIEVGGRQRIIGGASQQKLDV